MQKKNRRFLSLIHSGVEGMHWGERRYQNYDGSLTPLGRLHYGVGQGDRKHYTVSSMRNYPTYGTKHPGQGYGLSSRLGSNFGGKAVSDAASSLLPVMQDERRKIAGQMLNFKKTDPRMSGRGVDRAREYDIDRAASLMRKMQTTNRAISAARLEIKTKDIPYTKDLEAMQRRGANSLTSSPIGHDQQLVTSCLLGLGYLKEHHGDKTPNPYISGSTKSTSQNFLDLINTGKLFLEGSDSGYTSFDKRTTGYIFPRNGLYDIERLSNGVHQDYAGKIIR